MKELIYQFKYGSVRRKMVLCYMVTMLLTFAINLFLFIDMNNLMERVGKIYDSNYELNNLSSALLKVRSNTADYLDTKDTDAVEQYYDSVSDYSSLLNDFGKSSTDAEVIYIENNIKSLSQAYMDVTEDAINYKRGRDIEKYRASYERSETIYGYISSYIYSLNNLRFDKNAQAYGSMMNQITYTQVLNIIMMGLVSALNLTLIILITGNLIGPLKELADASEEISRGNFDIEIANNSSSSEIRMLTQAISRMAIEIKNYIERLKDSLEAENRMKENELVMEANLKDARLKYLQAQIDPHFLFNTLNAGAQLSMMESAPRTYDYIQNVADFFRYNINNDEDTVKLSTELGIVSNYIHIINVRFSGEIHYHEEIDENCLGVYIPKMTIQPVIENSISHGVRNISWEKHINLVIFREEDFVNIIISDNGIGMTQDELAMIREGKSTHQGEDSNGVGLNNVISRLKIFTGRDDCFAMNSEGADMGVETMIRLPLCEEV